MSGCRHWRSFKDDDGRWETLGNAERCWAWRARCLVTAAVRLLPDLPSGPHWLICHAGPSTTEARVQSSSLSCRPAPTPASLPHRWRWRRTPSRGTAPPGDRCPATAKAQGASLGPPWWGGSGGTKSFNGWMLYHFFSFQFSFSGDFSH